MSSYVYIKVVIRTEEEARLSPADRGFLLGDGLFETILARKGRPLFLKEHMMRLRCGLKDLAFNEAALQGFFQEIEGNLISKLIKKNRLEDNDTRIRITISRGISRGGLAPSPACEPTVIISAAPVENKKIGRKVTEGISAITLKGLRPALPMIKTLNFMPNILGASRAKKTGAEEGFFTAPDDNTILEGTSSNIFIVTKDRLLTPPAASEIGDAGALPGVVRKVVLELALEKKILAQKTWFTTTELLTAKEVFITNSISGVVPVVSVDSEPIGDGSVGSLTREMQEGYEEKISAFF